MRHTRQQWLS
ncbi:hypothetical protein VCCP10303_0006, partial [Vibrio cholerae CP1030(3)]